MSVFANSEVPDEMPQNAQYFMEIITCDLLIYTMDHPNFIVCSFTEHSIGLKQVILTSFVFY